MYYFVYETTNLVNDKKYRGIHKTDIIEDVYIGSGIAFVKAVKKYGKENFVRSILEFCSSYEELIEREKVWVDENWILEDSNYNLKTGGQSAGLLSEDSKKKISETLKRKYDSGEIKVIVTEDTKRKISQANKGRIIDEAQKEKISNTLKGNIPWNKGKKGVQVPWNKGIKGAQVAWNKGLKQPITEERREKLKGKTPWNKNIKGTQVAWNKGVEMEKVECPHCKKLVDKGNAKRWHFDNCKLINN